MEEITREYPFIKKISLTNASGFLAAAALFVPHIYETFKTKSEYRWAILGLYFIFIFFLAVRKQALQESHLPVALYLALQTSLVVSLLALPPQHEYTLILFFILSAEATSLLPEKQGYLWIGVFTLITAGRFIWLDDLKTALYDFPIYAGGYFFFGAFSAAAAHAEAARAESQSLLKDLTKAHQKLKRYAAQAEELAVAEERNRLAREMHDTLGHRLTVTIVQLEGAERLMDKEPQRAKKMLGTVKEQMRAALKELRATLATLRKPLQADLSITHALKTLGQNFQEATGTEVQLAFAHDLPTLPNSYRTGIYRVAQEALTNIQRHAQAKHIRISLLFNKKDKTIELSVQDDGIGIPPNADTLGFGLRGIQERAVQLGGKARIEKRADVGGTRISFRLPIPSIGEREDGDAP